jgi:uncharacterized protein (TIGR03067 family)
MTAILLAALALVPVPEDGGAKAALANFQGVWKATAVESRGRNLLAGFGQRTPDAYTLVVAGDAYVLNSHSGTVRFDLAKKHIDLTITEGRFKGATLTGIYELKDGTLKIALPGPSRPAERPADFKSAQESLYVYTFTREDATAEKAAAKLKELKAAVAAQAAPLARSDSTATLLREVIERLDRIEKRLDAMEKKEPGKKDPDKK